MKKFFVDRIDGENVFCEDENGEDIKFDLNATNGGIREGDIVFEDEHGIIKTDFDATLIRKKKISNLKNYVYGAESQND